MTSSRPTSPTTSISTCSTSLNINPDSPYVLRDISSRRSNSDEEVEIPAIEKNKKYYVAVTSYLGDFSNAPYAIRLRTDAATALPECRAVTGPSAP